jgi:RNA-directed DNA polymerase
VSPVRGDAWVPGSDAPVRDREVGCEAGRSDRAVRLPLEWAVEDLNRAPRGWGNYFRYGNSGEKFNHIDSYVNERLAILASAKHGLQGRNWRDRFNYEWATQLGIYRLSGTVTPTLAYASR